MMGKTVTIRLQEGVSAAQAAMHAQELRKRILDAAPEGVKVTLQPGNAANMNLGNEVVIHFTGALLAHVVSKVIEMFTERFRVGAEVSAGDESVVVRAGAPESTRAAENLIERVLKPT